MRRASRVFGLVLALLASQQALAANLPAFKPYATMTQEDIDDCGKDAKGKGIAVTSN